MRICKKCNQSKELNAFKKHSNGYRHVCKACKYLAEMSNSTTRAKKNARSKAYRASELGKTTNMLYVQSDAGKASRKAAVLKYQQGSGKAKKLANTVTRRLAKMQRTPKWLTEIDYERIGNEYKLADILTKLTSSAWHVDHIIPLQGKMVSGLHVPSNLRVLPAKDNISKSNTFAAL